MRQMPCDSLAKLHGRSWLQTGSRLLYTGRREALFEFECKSFLKINFYARTVCAKCLATLSQNCTAGHGFRLDLDFFTRAGVRCYLNSNVKKLIFTHERMCDVHKTERAVRPFVVRSISVPSPFYLNGQV